MESSPDSDLAYYQQLGSDDWAAKTTLRYYIDFKFSALSDGNPSSCIPDFSHNDIKVTEELSSYSSALLTKHLLIHCSLHLSDRKPLIFRVCSFEFSATLTTLSIYGLKLKVYKDALPANHTSVLKTVY